MDTVFLSRLLFGLTAGYHFIFPSLSLGMILVILIIEAVYLKTDSDIYKKISTSLLKIFSLIFTMGVATGIVLEFSFGTNWAAYSRMVGDIFGAPLAAEGIFAFFLESVFLGVVIFARNRVSKKTYFFSVVMVFIGAHLSGLWILIANSWMQTPAGYEIVNGRAILTDFFQAAINHSTAQRFLHTIIGSWICGSLFSAAVASWHILKDKTNSAASVLFKISFIIFILSSFAQFGTGHYHAVQVANTQPEKMAAFEALWKTQKRAPMSLIGIPDEENKVTHFEIALPGVLSLLINFDIESEVKGLEEFPETEQPPVLVTYMSYHVMIALGSLFVLISLAGICLIKAKRINDFRLFHYLILFSAPLPVLANEVGWISAEVGRQPWAVYRILKTSDAVSAAVSYGEVLFSVIMFSVIYIILSFLFIRMLRKLLSSFPVIRD